MSEATRYDRSEPMLASARDLDDTQVADVAIGLADGPGGRFRALQRLRTTLREAVELAGKTAQVVAGKTRETLLDPHCRPAAIRITSPRGNDDGACILLDYDVGQVAESEKRPRVSRPLRLVMIAREDRKTK